MVFGFGKKKTQEHPTAPVHNEKVITLEDIPGMLQDTESPRVAEVISIAKTTKEEVETHKKKIRELILQLEESDYKQIRDIFLKPQVIDVPEIKFADVDYAGIVSYLTKERSFSLDRVDTSLNRLKKALEKKSHNLEQWFT